MSSRSGDVTRLAQAIKPFGLVIVPSRKHRKILNSEGKTVWHMSSTPSCPYFAVNTLHDLKRRGLVPRDVHL